MFQGETAITIDDKGRLAIPTSYRDLVARECGNRLVITYNPFESGCLYLYPQPVWERLRDQVNALPRTKKNSRLLQLKLVGAASFVEPDGSGRISIPAWNSSTPWRGRSACTWAVTSTRWRPAIRCTSIQPCRTPIGEAAAGPAALSS